VGGKGRKGRQGAGRSQWGAALVQRVATILLHFAGVAAFVVLVVACKRFWHFLVFVANLKSRAEPEGVRPSRWAWHGQPTHTHTHTPTPTHTLKRRQPCAKPCGNFCGCEKLKTFHGPS